MKLVIVIPGTEQKFDPIHNITWPPKLLVKNDFIQLQIYRSKDLVISENPAIYWNFSTFISVIKKGGDFEKLLASSENVVEFSHDFEHIEELAYQGDLELYEFINENNPNQSIAIAYNIDFRR